MRTRHGRHRAGPPPSMVPDWLAVVLAGAAWALLIMLAAAGLTWWWPW